MYKRIRDLREDRDLSQIEVAKFLNMSQTGYSKYEVGTNDIPTKILIQLAKFYNTSIDYLLLSIFIGLFACYICQLLKEIIFNIFLIIPYIYMNFYLWWKKFSLFAKYCRYFYLYFCNKKWGKFDCPIC